MNRCVFAFVLLALLPAGAAADDADAMQKSANDFYAVILPDISGIPDAATRAKIRPTISPALDALLGQAAAAEADFGTAHKNSPPLVEGDLFSSLFEGANGFTVGACDAAAGTCAVALSYNDKSAKPVHWTDTLYLVNTPAGWRVDDIGFGGSWDFANKGRLSEALKQVIKNVSN